MPIIEHLDCVVFSGTGSRELRRIYGIIPCQRIQEIIDSLREVLAFAFEASLMMGQAQQSAITRMLAAWAAILAVPTALAGIYGMNFDNMPELTWRLGYPVTVAVMVAIDGYLFYRFRTAKWL